MSTEQQKNNKTQQIAKDQQEKPEIIQNTEEQQTKKHISIADMLLKQMEDEYEYVQSFNNKSYSAMQAKAQEAKNNEQNEEQDQDAPDGYQKLDFEYEVGGISSDSEQQSDQNNKNTNQQHDNKENQIQKVTNPQTCQLVEVGPVPESVFAVPEPEINIDVDKIKSFALQMDIGIPDWAKDEKICQQRIKQLFKIQNKPKCAK